MYDNQELNDVVEQLEMLGEESPAYLNKQTGELYMVMEEELLGVEEDLFAVDDDAEEGGSEKEELFEDPEWLREAKAKAREVVNSDDWIDLPSKFDIHEYTIMEDFCRDVDDAEISERLLRSIRGSGAFGRFKAAIDVLGIEQDWYQFRREAFEKIAIEWLEGNGIEYIK
jgi:hypothetical protein